MSKIHSRGVLLSCEYIVYSCTGTRAECEGCPCAGAVSYFAHFPISAAETRTECHETPNDAAAAVCTLALDMLADSKRLEWIEDCEADGLTPRIIAELGRGQPWTPYFLPRVLA